MFPWTCPFCDRNATITPVDTKTESVDLTITNNEGPKRLVVTYIVCPNPNCKKFTLTTTLFNLTKIEDVNVRYKRGEIIKKWSLTPSSEAKTYPDYIPAVILRDYDEACLIKDLSPKASATLSRRCLQGIIRDFWGIKKSRLVDEIEGIKDKIDPLTWDAIDAVRKIGNIGAHMEKDINIILDVEPNEAAMLIELIELLLNDWYINRHERQQRLQNIIDVKISKDQLKTQQTNP